MLKYFGYSDYVAAWDDFSHDTYLDCYLSITKEFSLPEIVKGFRCETFKSKDAMNNEFEFTMSYGYPEDEDDIDSVEKLIGLTYRFDNGVSLEIPKINGWSLGEKINQNIKKRKRNKNIESLLKIN